jgi:hypothetical protein
MMVGNTFELRRALTGNPQTAMIIAFTALGLLLFIDPVAFLADLLPSEVGGNTPIPASI